MNTDCTNPIDSGEARQDADAAEWIDLQRTGQLRQLLPDQPHRSSRGCEPEASSTATTPGAPWTSKMKMNPRLGVQRTLLPAQSTLRPISLIMITITMTTTIEDTSRPRAPHRRTKSPRSPGAKAKGAPASPEETYASRHGAAEPAVPDYDSDAGHEDDSPLHSGDEDHDKGFKAQKGKAPKYALSDDDDDYDANDDEEDYDDDEDEEEEEEEPTPRGRKVKKHGVGSSSRGFVQRER